MLDAGVRTFRRAQRRGWTWAGNPPWCASRAIRKERHAVNRRRDAIKARHLRLRFVRWAAVGVERYPIRALSFRRLTHAPDLREHLVWRIAICADSHGEQAAVLVLLLP